MQATSHIINNNVDKIASLNNSHNDTVTSSRVCFHYLCLSVNSLVNRAKFFTDCIRNSQIKFTHYTTKIVEQIMHPLEPSFNAAHNGNN